jgi:hypothetical protein
MPRDIPTYTQCAEPGDAKSWRQIPGLPGYLTSLIFTTGSLVAVIAFVLMFLAAAIVLAAAGGSVVGFIVFVLLLIVALAEVKDWYYNHRLLCIRDRDCAIGTVIKEPTENFDGDYVLNLMLAPFTRCDWTTALRTHLSVNRAMLSDPTNFNDTPFYSTGMPTLPSDTDLADFNTLQNYVKELQSKNPDEYPQESESTPNMFRQVMIGVVARLMLDSARNFYERFFRKDQDEIGTTGTPLWDAIPDDNDPAVDWTQPNAKSTKTQNDPYSQLDAQTLNPMFRIDVPHLVPFLHAEIEGYRVALIINHLLVILIMILGILVLIAWLGPLAVLIVALIFFILLLIFTIIEDLTGNDGSADPPDTQWDEPGDPGDGVPQRKGDVILVYGNHIMDTDHYEYFEIHPIRAYYLLSRDSGMWSADPSFDGEPCDPANENSLQTMVDKNFADEACQIVAQAEELPPDGTIERKAPTLLSYGMTTRYAGGGAFRP